VHLILQFEKTEVNLHSHVSKINKFLNLKTLYMIWSFVVKVQIAKDVTIYLAWAAEPEADERKLVSLLYLCFCSFGLFI